MIFVWCNPSSIPALTCALVYSAKERKLSGHALRSPTGTANKFTVDPVLACFQHSCGVSSHSGIKDEHTRDVEQLRSCYEVFLLYVYLLHVYSYVEYLQGMLLQHLRCQTIQGLISKPFHTVMPSLAPGILLYSSEHECRVSYVLFKKDNG